MNFYPNTDVDDVVVNSKINVICDITILVKDDKIYKNLKYCSKYIDSFPKIKDEIVNGVWKTTSFGFKLAVKFLNDIYEFYHARPGKLENVFTADIINLYNLAMQYEMTDLASFYSIGFNNCKLYSRFYDLMIKNNIPFETIANTYLNLGVNEGERELTSRFTTELWRVIILSPRIAKISEAWILCWANMSSKMVEETISAYDSKYIQKCDVLFVFSLRGLKGFKLNKKIISVQSYILQRIYFMSHTFNIFPIELKDSFSKESIESEFKASERKKKTLDQKITEARNNLTDLLQLKYGNINETLKNMTREPNKGQKYSHNFY